MLAGDPQMACPMLLAAAFGESAAAGADVPLHRRARVVDTADGRADPQRRRHIGWHPALREVPGRRQPLTFAQRQRPECVPFAAGAASPVVGGDGVAAQDTVDLALRVGHQSPSRSRNATLNWV